MYNGYDIFQWECFRVHIFYLVTLAMEVQHISKCIIFYFMLTSNHYQGN